MYLKEIEISGFKSFADKININLDNKITCIVGPNGSGKSNIVDAIRFVLGEQSVKSLRGDALMSDVIFGGSKNRNPMHVASVALTFDNSDNYLKVPYNTICVKRRLYKTGDNEYFLNGEKCRLKDILDLFLDSTIGRDSFNIIGQGEISKILSNSPLERRLVIEEASGILKYKKRREEAFKKLDKTNLNLERVNDIIGEVETRVEPLRKQSKKAKEYLEVKEKLENVEVALLTTEITEDNLKYQDTKDKIKIKNENISKLNMDLNDPLIEEMKTKELSLEKEYQKMNALLLKKTEEKEELNSNRLILNERSKYDANDMKVQENIIHLKENKLSLENETKLLNKELDTKNLEKKSLEEMINKLLDEVNDLKTKKENTLKEYNIKIKENYALKSKIDILKNNLADNLYLNSNVKKILDNPRLRGIHNAIINLVSVTEEYEKALEVTMNSIKNFIIVDNSDAANDAIEYLKASKGGRATFLPLDVIKPRFVDAATLDFIKNEDGFLGIMSDFLKFDLLYKNIILNQWGNIILVRDLKSGNQISKKINNKYRIVTLDGDVIHVGGSITGGSLPDVKSLSSIKSDLNDANIKASLNQNILESLEQELTSLEDTINIEDKKIYDKRSSLIILLDDINTLKNKILLNNKNIESTILELKSFDESSIEEQVIKLNEKYYQKQLECEELEADIKKILSDIEELKSSILEKEGEHKVYLSKRQQEEKELNALTILLNTLDSKLDNNLSILNTEYSLTYEKAKSDYFLDIDIEEARKEVIEYKNTLKEIGMVNLDAIKEFEEVNERYTYLTRERDDLLHAKDILYSIIDEMDEVMESDFLSTFKELEIEFKKVFKEMFHGGDATLSLTNPNNILETGVEITASPPGKKLKTITLLSGGEKTLTAISLLFAILNIRSVPFCVFDEVEAALDEANVDNFGTYLNHYQDKTQFLLITHKKRTMEYAKTLYGITMQESGVSKLVSVRLEDN